MAKIVICPHCGKRESWRGSAHTHCRFCEAPLQGSASSQPESSLRPPAQRVLEFTLYGLLVGPLLPLILSVLLNGAPIYLFFAGVERLGPKAFDAIFLPVIEGLLFGPLLMAMSGLLLWRWPTLHRAAGIGAILGTLLAPGLAAIVVLYVPDNASNIFVTLFRVWLWSLLFMPVGAVFGAVLLPLLAWLRIASRPSGRDSVAD